MLIVPVSLCSTARSVSSGSNFGRMTIVAACRKAGQRVNAVINHDGFRLNENLVDDYAGMVQYLQANYCATTTRYATSFSAGCEAPAHG